MMTKVRGTIREYEMLTEGDTVIVGLSGGADSVCLTEILYRLREELGITLLAVHVNHGLREAAGLDEAFAKDYCAARGIPFLAKQVDCRGYAAAHRIGTEEAGRILRREAFEEAADAAAEGCSGVMTTRARRPEEMAVADGHFPRVKIALGHHAGDQAETVLFHLCRGAGLAGSAGIRPVSGRYIHPLLAVTRPEIEAFLAENGIPFRTDRTNGDNAYARNRIRNVVLPYLTEEINAGAVRHIAEAAGEAGDAEDFLAACTGEAYGRCAKELRDGGISLDPAKLAQEKDYIAGRVLYFALTRAAGYRKDIGKVHVEALRALLSAGKGHADLPYNVQADLVTDDASTCRLVLRKERGAGPGAGAECGPGSAQHTGKTTGTNAFAGNFAGGAGAFLPGGIPCPLRKEDYAVHLFTAPEKAWTAIPADQCTKWFDYDKIRTSLTFRTRESGDYITLSPRGEKKKLNRCLIDAKVPVPLRDRMILPADGREILWIPGCRDTCSYRITPETRAILELKLRAGLQGGSRGKEEYV